MPTINPDLPSDGEDADVADYNSAIQAILSVLNGNIDEDNLAPGAIILTKLATAVQQALVPVGAIIPYGGATAPNAGFLLCDGSAVSRSTYADLFAVLGTAFGVGDGSTTFNVPDMRGRVAVGIDNLGGSAANRIQRSTTINTTSGSANATVGTTANMAVGMKITSANVPAGTTVATIITGTTITMSANATATASGTAARFSFITDANAIGSSGGVDVHQLSSAQMPSHSHSIAYANSGAAGSAVSALGGGSGTSTGGAGGDQPHPNVQPAVATNFIVKV